MKKNKSTRISNAAIVVFGAAILTSSADAGSPPSRQTPYLVPKDKMGVVETGPCQMPPCVGGKQCVPNARDYGYYEGTWRRWPTQQRYDQKFPQAVTSSAHPLPNQGNPTVIAPPNPARHTQMTQPPALDTNMISVPDDVEPTPTMGNYEGNNTILATPGTNAAPAAVPIQVNTPAPAPAAPVDPLLDFSTNTVPGISTAPAVQETPALVPLADPEIAPAPEEAEEAAEPETDAGNAEGSLAPPAEEADLETPPAIDDADAELTAPAPESASPLLDTEEEETNTVDADLAPALDAETDEEENGSDLSGEIDTNLEAAPAAEDQEDDSLSLPFTQNNTKERSIIVSQNENVTNPYETAQHVASNASAVTNPFQTAVIPSSFTETAEAPALTETSGSTETAPAAGSEETVQDVIQETAPRVSSPFEQPELNADAKVGLDGFCPVSLLDAEEWVEGDAQWTVMHHGVTYHLSSAAQVQKFLADPEAYTPVMDGADPVLANTTGEKTVGKTEFSVVFEGKLYMFTSEQNLNTFMEAPEKYQH